MILEMELTSLLVNLISLSNKMFFKRNNKPQISMFMEKQRGIWIDRHKAVIVDPSVDQKKFTQISSPLNNQSEIGTDSTRFSFQNQNPEKKLQAKRKKLLKEYYNHIINQLDNESDLFIFGPAGAKTELKKVIDKSCKQFKNVTLHPSDNLTDNQVVARVKEFFKD